MTENQNPNDQEGQDINELLRQLAESQGEGDSLFMMGRPPIDESKVDVTLLQEMKEFDEIIQNKMRDWESRFSEETLANTAAKLQEL